MINHKPHKKLYYTSGIISLLFLPILCVLYLQKTKVFEPIYTIELNTWIPNLSEHWISQGYDFYINPKRNYLNIYLNGNEKEDRTKLDFVQLYLRDLVKNKDTLSGVHIFFGNKSKYWEFIEIINISVKEKARQFSYIDNDFWFYNYYPKPAVKKQIKRGWLCGTRDYYFDQNQAFQQDNKTPRGLIIFYTLLSILFLLMCGFEIKKILE